jgi:hypothetical protein
MIANCLTALSMATAQNTSAAAVCALSSPISGEVTYIDGNYTDNACNRIPLIPGVFDIALSPQTGWAPFGKSCGNCVRLTDEETGKHIDAQVVDYASGINMGGEAYVALFGKLGGPKQASYVDIPCDDLEKGINNDKIRYRFKFGSRGPDYPKVYYLGIRYCVEHKLLACFVAQPF